VVEELEAQPDIPDDPPVLLGFQMLLFISSELNGSKIAAPPSSVASPDARPSTAAESPPHIAPPYAAAAAFELQSEADDGGVFQTSAEAG